jgi:3-phenylpropionate/trans-cinnamate dioxygenase ferredoxin reductase component
MPMTGHTVIVGTGAAGLAVAETLRSEGFRGDITMLGEEPTLPYERPPLSKQVLSGVWDIDRTRLRPPHHFVDNGVDLRLGTLAVGVETESRTVTLVGEETVCYDDLVIATGSVPNQLPDGHHLRGVHVLRSRRDLISMRESLSVAHRVVIVGAGFLGTEVASVLVERLDVTLVDPRPAPMTRQVGHTVGTLIAEMHRDRGVHMVTGVGVASVAGTDGRVSAVHLTDGRTLFADIVLVSIGATPATDWLRSSQLSLDDGVRCDAFCRAAPHVYAAGDVASWQNMRYGGQRMRLEHRRNATEQGQAVARNIVAESPTAFTPLPSFWSDQYGVRLQGYGLLSPDADVEFVDGAPGERHFIGLYTVDDQLMGVLAWNHPRRGQMYRHMLSNSWSQETAPSHGDRR